MKTAFAALIVAFATVAPVHAGNVTTAISMSIRDSNMHPQSAGLVQYFTVFGYESTTEPINVTHGIFNTDAYLSAAYIAPYNHRIEASQPASAPTCYKAHLSGSADDSYDSIDSENLCFQGPPPPGGGGSGSGGCTPSETNPCSGGGTDYGSGDTNCYNFGNCYSTPIVLNIGGGPYELTGLKEPVSFDLTGSGVAQNVGWIGHSGSLAFLAIDRNHNGVIDDGRELFGNHTPLADGSTAKTGFDALKEFDTSHDGVVGVADAIWPELLLWFDRNHNALTDPGELSPISTSGVTALEYAYHWTGRWDPRTRNLFCGEGHIHRGNVVIPYFDSDFIVQHQ